MLGFALRQATFVELPKANKYVPRNPNFRPDLLSMPFLLRVLGVQHPSPRLRYDVSLFLKLPHLGDPRCDGVVCAVVEHDHIRVVTFLDGKLIRSRVQNRSLRLCTQEV